ncbi:MAG: hypothetical protein V3R78_10095 [Thermodesulfobacteriota bacterium]
MFNRQAELDSIDRELKSLDKVKSWLPLDMEKRFLEMLDWKLEFWENFTKEDARVCGVDYV